MPHECLNVSSVRFKIDWIFYFENILTSTNRCVGIKQEHATTCKRKSVGIHWKKQTIFAFFFSFLFDLTHVRSNVWNERIEVSAFHVSLV